MAEIRFREVQELFGKALAEDQYLCNEALGEDKELCHEALAEDQRLDYERKIIEALSVEKKFLDDVLEIVFGIWESLTEGMSVAFSYLDKVLYARIYDSERYVFPLPFMLAEDSDAEVACLNLASYARREMIPLIISDVPRDELEFLCTVFPHIDAFTYEDDDDSFYVKVNNECDMLDEIPTLEFDGIVLDELGDSDKEKYSELCRDRSLNKYWGYDVDVDNPLGDADFYLDVVKREINEGVAIALAVRENGEFVGEATVYDFDYRGCASVAVRILPDCHSRGLGTRALGALIEFAKSIGLSEIRTEIMSENLNSIKMTSKYMQIINQEKGKVYFTLSLK